MNPASNQAVFLDRDGVINQVVFRHGKPSSPWLGEEFVWVEGIHEAVYRLKSSGFRLFVITNQPDIARKNLAPAVLAQMSERIWRELAIDDLQVCPHDEADACTCRKPKPGMVLTLAEKWSIDLTTSFIIGDSWKDMAAGNQAGCRTILIQYPYNLNVEADFKVDSPVAAAALILSQRSPAPLG